MMLVSGKHGNNASLIIVLVLSSIVGWSNGVLETCILGTGMNLPPQYPQVPALELLDPNVLSRLMQLEYLTQCSLCLCLECSQKLFSLGLTTV